MSVREAQLLRSLACEAPPSPPAPVILISNPSRVSRCFVSFIGECNRHRACRRSARWLSRSTRPRSCRPRRCPPSPQRCSSAAQSRCSSPARRCRRQHRSVAAKEASFHVKCICSAAHLTISQGPNTVIVQLAAEAMIEGTDGPYVLHHCTAAEDHLSCCDMKQHRRRPDRYSACGDHLAPHHSPRAHNVA